MNKILRNKFYDDNKEAIENIVDYAINDNKQLLEVVRNYTGDYALKYTGYKSTNLANMFINHDDLRQHLLLEIFEVLSRNKQVNLSYIKQLCECRIKNIRRNYLYEADYFKDNKKGVEFDIVDTTANNDVLISNLHIRSVIDKALSLINNPKEKAYLITLAGNNGVKGYEKYAIKKTNKSESDDCLIAKKLGFDSAKRNKYVVIKNNVKKVLAEYIRDREDIA